MKQSHEAILLSHEQYQDVCFIEMFHRGQMRDMRFMTFEWHPVASVVLAKLWPCVQAADVGVPAV